MNDFLRNAHAADQNMPTDVRALEDAVGVRLVVADGGMAQILHHSGRLSERQKT